jgi:hypothetical protein
MAIYAKDPDAILDYGFDWSEWLASGETIVTSSWIVPDDDTSPSMALVKTSDSHDDSSTAIWLASGLPGETYQVTNRIVTSLGRRDDRSITIRIIER